MNKGKKTAVVGAEAGMFPSKRTQTESFAFYDNLDEVDPAWVLGSDVWRVLVSELASFTDKQEFKRLAAQPGCRVELVFFASQAMLSGLLEKVPDFDELEGSMSLIAPATLNAVQAEAVGISDSLDYPEETKGDGFDEDDGEPIDPPSEPQTLETRGAPIQVRRERKGEEMKKGKRSSGLNEFVDSKWSTVGDNKAAILKSAYEKFDGILKKGSIQVGVYRRLKELRDSGGPTAAANAKVPKVKRTARKKAEGNASPPAKARKKPGPKPKAQDSSVSDLLRQAVELLIQAGKGIERLERLEKLLAAVDEMRS